MALDRAIKLQWQLPVCFAIGHLTSRIEQPCLRPLYRSNCIRLHARRRPGYTHAALGRQQQAQNANRLRPASLIDLEPLVVSVR